MVFTIIQLNPFWFAVKEAAIPLLIGAFVLASAWSKKASYIAPT